MTTVSCDFSSSLLIFKNKHKLQLKLVELKPSTFKSEQSFLYSSIAVNLIMFLKILISI